MIIIATIFGCLLYVLEGRPRLRRHSHQRLLGDRHHHHGGLRRRDAGDYRWQGGIRGGHAGGLYHHCGPYRDHYRRIEHGQRVRKMRDMLEARNCTNCSAVEKDVHAHYSPVTAAPACRARDMRPSPKYQTKKAYYKL